MPRDSSVTFCVEATGTPPFSFQWRKNGVNIAGATDSCYTIPKVRIEDGGEHSVIVTSEAGSLVSDSAGLTITELPAGPPAEDDFADRLVLLGASGVVSGNNIGATKESGEPNHAGKPGGSSVWYTWQAPAKGIANFRTGGSSIDTLLAVYSGTSVSNLLALDSDEDRGGYLASEVRFNAHAGGFYEVAIDGYANSQGKFVLSWSLQETLEELPTITTQPKSQTVAQGAEALLQVVAAGQDLGYQWSLNGAPLAGANSSSLLIPRVQPVDVGTYTVRMANGQLRTIDTQGSSIATLLGVFTLDFTGLVSVSCNDHGAPDGRSSLVRFAAVPGTDYLIGVDGVGGETGVINGTNTLSLPLTKTTKFYRLRQP